MKHAQHIVCVPAAVVEDRVAGWSKYQLQGSHIVTAQRAVLESNDSYRQVLPLAVFKYKDSLWAYTRTPKGGEERLHNKVSVAVGGHFDCDDLITHDSVIDPIDSLSNALNRELQEEVTILSEYTVETLEVCLCADDTPVDRKHLGIVNILHMQSGCEIYSNEDQLEAIGFVPIVDLLADPALETWGVKICEYLLEND